MPMTSASTNRNAPKNGYDRHIGIATALAITALAMLLSGCRSSPVSPITGDILIKYVIPSTSHVTLKIENSYNTTVATLVDSTENAGVYSVTWNTSGFLAGLYTYYLNVDPLGGGKSESLVKEVVIN